MKITSNHSTIIQLRVYDKGELKQRNFSMCCDDNDLMQRNEIERSSPYTRGEIPLPVCTGCFNLGVKLPTSGGRISKKVSVQNEKANKK